MMQHESKQKPMQGARVTWKKPPLTPTYGKNIYLFFQFGSSGIKEKTFENKVRGTIQNSP